MPFTSLENIVKQGFTGCVKVSDLQTIKGAYEQIPDEAGVYFILRLAQSEAEFLILNPSRIYGKHKEKPHLHSFPVQILQKKFEKVKTSVVVYIGKAGGKESGATLRSRLKEYMDAGLTTKGSNSHSGGRAIWQLKDSADLLICWKASHKDDAEDLERTLLKQFKSLYGSLPLANRRM
jgi:hypothetical protein